MKSELRLFHRHSSHCVFSNTIQNLPCGRGTRTRIGKYCCCSRESLWNIPTRCLTFTTRRNDACSNCKGGEHEVVTARHFNSILLTADGGGANPASTHQLCGHDRFDR